MAILKSKRAHVGHAAGIYSDLTLDGPEIGTLVAVVDRAKNLPNRKTIGKQDPYCAMRLAKEAKKTDTDRRGGQTPKWDQELRFIVHDSPDYYKLKVSVFNDDKKTDLIGEAWIDLTDVVKLGGGQADLWQQLTFKGKYAGEVRTELTFYDTREKPQEKRRTKEKQQITPTNSSSDISLPAQRSLGPREIMRRPLPVSPAAAAAAAAASPTPQSVPQAEPLAPQRPPKEPSEEQPQVHAPVARRLRGASASPHPEPTQEQPYDERHGQTGATYQDQHYQQPQQQYTHSLPPELPQQPQQYPPGQQYQEYQPDSRDFDGAYLKTGYELDVYQPESHMVPSPYPDSRENWQDHRPQSVHMHSEPVTPQHSSPFARPTPPSVNSDSQLQRYHPHQGPDFEGAYASGYRDSPLRQSMSHHDIQPYPAEHAVAAPPLPPKHRDTPPRKQRNEYPPSAYTPQPLRVAPKRSSVSERSPLQLIEDDYDGRVQDEWESQQTLQRHSMYEALQPQQHEISEQQLQLYGRRQTYDTQPYLPGSQQYPPQSQPQVQRPTPQRRRNSYEIRHPSFGQQSLGEQMLEEPQSMMLIESRPSGFDQSRQPTVQDAPPSPGPSPDLQPALARKAVGDQPKRLSALPFGPDCYDVLNPAQSPVTNENTIFQTPAQAKEAQRMREVEKIRDLGPIIGNDGREIDPSDHLPSDTWAPEPERKNKKPEHVIHIRSKNDTNKPRGARASPIVIRHNHSASSPITPALTNSPAVQTPVSAGGRNKLQKSMPTRPLPNQPYGSPQTFSRNFPAAASSPALVGPPHHVHFDEVPQYQQRPAEPRRPSFDNRVPDHLTRPPLSEYQVPVGNSYQPRRASYNRPSPQRAIEPAYDTTPTKEHSHHAYSPSHEQSPYDSQYDYGYENSPSHPPPRVRQQQSQQHYDDALAAEMSLIDIGPSRNSYHQGSMGRSMVRSRGAYGM
ncbi:hypothetical protein H2198_000852 [Neophaeococcomyces mojaviensis]|uniref:Uncharacterized protein n=1 Tax=Neophaeococcomyces mojaviensis TaxID=3383035 RepID=A0ACC3AIL9_9EURO|nr:hypothetical protein H2198_000852 [Knufia sp. JES_112]